MEMLKSMIVGVSDDFVKGGKNAVNQIVALTTIGSDTTQMQSHLAEAGNIFLRALSTASENFGHHELYVVAEEVTELFKVLAMAADYSSVADITALKGYFDTMTKIAKAIVA